MLKLPDVTGATEGRRRTETKLSSLALPGLKTTQSNTVVTVSVLNSARQVLSRINSGLKRWLQYFRGFIGLFLTIDGVKSSALP
jgi:hypothetical protein